MALDYEKFMMKQTQWRGEVTAKLENINSDVIEIKNDVKDVREDIKKLNRRLDRTNIRVASIAGGISIIVVIIGYIVPSVLGKLI